MDGFLYKKTHLKMKLDHFADNTKRTVIDYMKALQYPLK